MPLVHIHISEGKPPEKKQELMEAITKAIQVSLGADEKAIRIFVHEFPLSNYMGTPI